SGLSDPCSLQQAYRRAGVPSEHGSGDRGQAAGAHRPPRGTRRLVPGWDRLTFGYGPARTTTTTTEETAMAEYSLPDLPYDYAALEPNVSGQIMELHHDKHHAAYVAGANQTLEKLEGARDK